MDDFGNDTNLINISACEPGPDGSCSICADEALPGWVVALQPDQMATVEMAGQLMDVALDLVEGVQVGTTVLVHLGVAIAVLEPEA